MLVGARSEFAATRCANDELGKQEERLDFIDERIERGVHRMGDGFHTSGAAVENARDGLQVLAILRVETEFVDLELCKCGVGDCQIDVASGFTGRIIPHPAEAVIGNARCSAAARGYLL